MNSQNIVSMNSETTNSEQLAIKKKVEELELKNKIQRFFEENPSSRKVLPDGEVILDGK